MSHDKGHNSTDKQYVNVAIRDGQLRSEKTKQQQYKLRVKKNKKNKKKIRENLEQDDIE
jgi:hypothetical protein